MHTPEIQCPVVRIPCWFMVIHVVSCSFALPSSLAIRGTMDGLKHSAGVIIIMLISEYHAPYRYFDSRRRNETMMFSESFASSPIVVTTRVELFGVRPLCRRHSPIRRSVVLHASGSMSVVFFNYKYTACDL